MRRLFQEAPLAFAVKRTTLVLVLVVVLHQGDYDYENENENKREMTHHEAETLALLKLKMSEGVGNAAVHRLVEAFGSAEAALSAPKDRLRGIEGICETVVQSLSHGPDESAVETELELMSRAKVRLVPFLSEDYPPPLKQLESDAPPLLWIKGDYERRDQLSVAVVGSRRCSHYGRTQARRFAMGLAGMGFSIVSGLARGIDSEAHRGALQAGGRTIAVLGCGLGQLPGLDEWELACEIAEHGALISELPMTTPPRPGNFPPRNRLISALSLGVLVVEASTRSGSLITARWAGEQGKSVFAVPGDVESPTSRGCHRLIRDGAILVEDARGVVEGLGPLSEPIDLLAAPGQQEGELTVDDARAMALNERERQIFDLLSHAPNHIDSVVAETGLPVSIVSSTLLTLEIRGLAKHLPGQNYVRA